MPEKSVREMGALERKHYSLSGKVFRLVIIGSLILGLVAFAIGLGLYSVALTDKYISESFNLAKTAENMLDKIASVETAAKRVMTTYNELTPEEKAEVGTEQYRARFSMINKAAGMDTIRSILGEFAQSADVNDVYLGMYSEEDSALVIIADPDSTDETGACAGDWEPVEAKEVAKFLNWDGTGELYHISRTSRYGWICTSGVPVKNISGDIVCFVLADVTLDEVAKGMGRFVLQYVVAIVVVMMLMALLFTRHMKKKLVDPINDIAAAAGQYVADKKSGAQVTDHFAMLNIRTGDEIENLSYIMADMERDLSEFEENLTKATAEKERIGLELSLATRIQADMLPNVFPAFPDRGEFDIYASMDPAKEVGGDFYDFFFTDDDHLALVIADVSGKGVPAALFMMASKILVKNYCKAGYSPAAVLEAVNEQICSNNREELFVTVWLGIIDLNTGIMTAANAGHEYPMIAGPDGEFTLYKDKHGFVIGGMPGMKYKEYELQMEPGSRLFVYTDGVVESTNLSSDLFGTERTLKVINKARDRSPQGVLKAVDDAIATFVGTADQFDDITMLCFRYFGKNAETTMDKELKEMTLTAVPANTDKVTEFLNAELKAAGCPRKTIAQIDVAVDEIFANISSYAYEPATGLATVRIGLEEDPKAAVITFVDRGKPFDPLSADSPDTTLSADDREIGGLGIFIVRQTMDDVKYSYEDGQNILTIKKRFQGVE
ncbi:MAG: SpoIIE family protein phosphatase [Clostridia bacterium]|nr:SpoIIE family protein phosphatase [Clostridia bacterium]